MEMRRFDARRSSIATTLRDVFMDIPCAFAVSGGICDSICHTLAVYGCRLAAKGMTTIARLVSVLGEPYIDKSTCRKGDDHDCEYVSLLVRVCRDSC